MNLQYWIEAEDKWQDQQGVVNDHIWYKKMINIYENLVKLDAKNVDYRVWLAKYLMEYATDLKIQYENYHKAMKLFQSVITLQPNNGLAHYHIGYIHFMNKNRQQALINFEVALKSTDISNHQRIRANLACSICLHKTGSIEDAEEFYQEAKKLDVNRELSTEFQLTRMQIEEPVEEGMKPYLLFSRNSSTIQLTKDEHYEIVEIEKGDTTILDLSNEMQPQFSTTKKPVILQPKEAQLLKELVLSKNICSTEWLLESVWETNEDRDRVKKYIKRLRVKLAPCFDEDMTEIIKTEIRKGYKWNDLVNVKVITVNKGIFY